MTVLDIMAIDRKFRDLSQQDLADIESANLLARIDPSDGITWPELLRSPRILIISEAGTGKTFECRQRQKLLWDAGEPAFFVDLATLAADGLDLCLFPDELVRMNRWRDTGPATATFFLDSVDELKLSGVGVEKALRRLSQGIGGQFERTRIIITARPIPLDPEAFHRLLPLASAAPQTADFADIAMGRHPRPAEADARNLPPPWRIVALSPLNDAEICAIAAANGIVDPNALLAAISRQSAEDFARRPQDLIELCADWRETRRIRTHRDHVERNIDVKLMPRIDRQEPAQLSPERAIDGAMRLALAVMLTRKLTIRHNAEADRAGPPDSALDPASILLDWTTGERQALLERALFGFASYGRVRFHHRSVIEYLAAKQIERLLARGKSVRALKRLLFGETPYGDAVVKPAMRPVAAWLAASHAAFFEEVLCREPQLLLTDADPQSLTPPQRAQALRAHVQRHGRGGWRGLHVPRIQVQRFANPDLSAEASRLWLEGVQNPEVRELLLELIGAGPMPSCAGIAVTVALDAEAKRGERLDAIGALIALSDPRLADIVRSIETDPKRWPDAVLRRVFVELFPQWIRPAHAHVVLARLSASHSSTDIIAWALPRVIAKADLVTSDSLSLLVGLLAIVESGLSWNLATSRHVVARPDLIPALAATLLRLIVDVPPTPVMVRALVTVIGLQPETLIDRTGRPALIDIINTAPPALREAVFWAADRLNQQFNPKDDAWERGFGVFHLRVLQINAEQDANWLKRNLADLGRTKVERRMLLDILLRLFSRSEASWQHHIQDLRSRVADLPELSDILDTALSKPEVDPEMARLEAEHARHQEQVQRDVDRKKDEWIAFQHDLMSDPDAAFDPIQVASTLINLCRVMRASGEDEVRGGWSRSFLEQHFNRDLAERVRGALAAHWRRTVPTLRQERAPSERSMYLEVWQIGLAGVTAESEDPHWARHLSMDEAALAARYAPIHLNCFPVWLEGLTTARPEAVERTLGPELTAELNGPAEPQSSGLLLQDVEYAVPLVARLFLPRITSWVAENADRARPEDDAPAAAARLRRSIDVLLKHGDEADHASIRAMAAARLPTAPTAELHRLWLSLLLRLDPAAGVQALEQQVDSVPPSTEGPAVHWFATLFSDRETGLTVDLRQPSYTPDLLLRLNRLAHRHVRPSDDRQHEGVFTADARDDAERARGSILSALFNCSGADAWRAKLTLAADPLFANMRDRVERWAREKEAEAIDIAARTERDVVDLLRYGESPPATRDELFALLLDRLNDIEDLLLRDTSPREAWAGFTMERVMRRELARTLDGMANHAYSVDQEAVTADEKETDIRLRSTASPQQATIELKLGERYSGAQLRATLTDQLVTRYMAAETSRAGCLLVTVSTNKAWEHPDTGELLDAAALQKMLELEADRIVGAMGGTLRLAAKVLDLRPRLL